MTNDLRRMINMTETQAQLVRPASAGPSEPTHRPQPNYMKVFAFLAVLTAIEVFTAFTIRTPWLKVSALGAMAIAKAGLVVAYYMHLRFEKAPLRIIAFGPLVLVLLLSTVLFLERTLAR
jgi:cytochrome c oxidase subunit IV